MSVTFASVLSGLRRDKNLSQRQAASDLGISQALLSHYENGLREPRLEFVVRACDYYGVTADYILGRTDSAGGEEAMEELISELCRLSDRAEKALTSRKNHASSMKK